MAMSNQKKIMTMIGTTKMISNILLIMMVITIMMLTLMMMMIVSGSSALNGSSLNDVVVLNLLSLSSSPFFDNAWNYHYQHYHHHDQHHNTTDDSVGMEVVVVSSTTATTINCTDYNCSYNGECIIVWPVNNHSGTSNIKATTGSENSTANDSFSSSSSSSFDSSSSSSWYCQCDYGWKGKYCEQLNLGIAINGSGLSHMLHTITNPTSTWGGSVIYDIKTNLYHMFYSEIKNNCEKLLV